MITLIVSSGISTVASLCPNPADSGPKGGIRVFDPGAVVPCCKDPQ